MMQQGKFYVADFESQLWDVIESENQVADFPTIGFRYPKVTREIGDIVVYVCWRVENMYQGHDIQSIYSHIKYYAQIKGVNGAFCGELKQKYETYYN
jgi:hypothetical protein